MNNNNSSNRKIMNILPYKLYSIERNRHFLIILLALFIAITLTFQSCSFIEDILGLKDNNPTENNENSYSLLDQWFLNFTPNGIAIDNDGYIYILTKINTDYNVFKYDSSGSQLNNWTLSDYYSVDISAYTEIYLAGDDGSYNIIKSFFPNGTPITDWTIDEYPWAITCLHDGSVVVIGENDNNEFSILHKNGEIISSWTVNITGYPTYLDITADIDNNIYTSYLTYADSYLSGIKKYSHDGNFILEWDISEMPYYLSTDYDGNIFLVCAYNNGNSYMIKKFTPEGSLINEWDISSSPQGIAIDQSGLVYIPISSSFTGDNYVLIFSNK